MQQPCLFGPNFLEKFVGKAILYDSKVATVELVANAWDAGATKVNITWPTQSNEQFFCIEDNGSGLSESEFLSRWRTLAYDRLATQGDHVIVDHRRRTVFGKNGVGRFAGFCFAESYFVESTHAGETFEYEVKIGSGETPFTLIKHQVLANRAANGTKISTRATISTPVSESLILSEIGMRFLTDPMFECFLNHAKVSFAHIPNNNIDYQEVEVDGNIVKITIIDTIESDKTTKQHGIAWHVNGRLVGEANWRNYGFDEIIDGRSNEAKRHTFIIDADFLAKTESVKKDWTGFNETKEFIAVKNQVFDVVKSHVLGLTKKKRSQIFEAVKKNNEAELNSLTPLRKERWTELVTTVQEECTGISQRDLTKLGGILVKMEKSSSKYSLISKLHELNSAQIDNLHDILSDWSLDLAKEVLDELQVRLKLLDELKERVLDTSTREVQELQPLFHQGLWIFGPEYETIEFTSNEGMTRVIQHLFKVDPDTDIKGKASRNRPDFAILPDSTVGTYGYPTYDQDGGEIGVDRLVLVELKKPGVKISTDEKAQCWKYVSELLKTGLIDRKTKVTCFVLGSSIDPYEKEARRENNDNCIIQPMDYQVVISRAQSRLHKLYNRVKGAPFLEEQRDKRDAEQEVMDF